MNQTLCDNCKKEVGRHWHTLAKQGPVAWTEPRSPEARPSYSTFTQASTQPVDLCSWECVEEYAHNRTKAVTQREGEKVRQQYLEAQGTKRYLGKE